MELMLTMVPLLLIRCGRAACTHVHTCNHLPVILQIQAYAVLSTCPFWTVGSVHTALASASHRGFLHAVACVVVALCLHPCRLKPHGSDMCLAQGYMRVVSQVACESEHQPPNRHTDTARVGSQPRGPIELMKKRSS